MDKTIKKKTNNCVLILPP